MGNARGVEEAERKEPLGAAGMGEAERAGRFQAGLCGSLSGPARTKRVGACTGGPRTTLSTTHSPHLGAQTGAFAPQSR